MVGLSLNGRAEGRNKGEMTLVCQSRKGVNETKTKPI